MKYIQDIQDIINEMELNQQPINEIAHYTSIVALNSIINGISILETSEAYLTLRATYALETDDPDELKEGFEFLIEMLSYIEEGSIDKCRLTTYMDDVKASDRFNHFSEEEIKRWLFGGKRTPFIISFSRYINKLSMWQTPYAKNGEGVCLVFNFSTMVNKTEFININNPFPITYGKRLGYLNYKNLFYDLIRWEYHVFVKKVKCLSNKDDIISQKLQSLEEMCAFISSYFKRENWSFQQEVRIMCTTIVDNPSCVKSDEKGRRFVEVPVPISCLKQVILGPKVKDDYVNEIREKLTPYGFSPDNIIKSKEPLQ